MINPFNDRRLIELTTRIPPKARRRRRLVNHVVRSRMPELDDIAYSAEYIRKLREERAEAG